MKREINFFGVRKIAVTISLLLMLASVIVVTLMGIERGVQFVGGTEVQVKFRSEVGIDQLRRAFVEAGFPKATIVKVEGGNEYIIKLKGREGDETRKGSDVSRRVSHLLATVSGEEERDGIDLNKINATDLGRLLRKANPKGLSETDLIGESRTVYEETAERIIAVRGQKGDFFHSLDELDPIVTDEAILNYLKEHAYLGNYVKLKEDTFSPSISAEQTEKAILAIVMALGAILVYVTIRFKLNYALGAILALVHDVTITLGAFALFRQEFSLPVVAAFLTIVGYSLNDTIVVFDRIRENVKLIKAKPLEEIINRSINQTISRTLLTSLTTLFVVVVLFFFGGVALKGFSFPLLVGIVVGTYSSIYIASPVFYYMERHITKKK